MGEHAKLAADGLSLAAAIGAFVAWLPPLAAFASLVWTGIRIYEWAREKKKGRRPKGLKA